MSRVNNIIGSVKNNGTEKKKSRVESIIEGSSNGNLKTGVDEKYINSFINDANDYFTNFSNDYKNVGYNNASSLYENCSSKSSELGSRANTIRAFLNSNKNKLDEDTYKQLTSTLVKLVKSRKSTFDSARRTSEYYSKWDTEEDYNQSVKDQEKLEKWADPNHLELLNSQSQAYTNIVDTYKGWDTRKAGTLNREATKDSGVITYYGKADEDAAIKERDEWFANATKQAFGKAYAYEEFTNTYGGISAEYVQAKRYQEGLKLHNDALSAADFSTFSLPDSAITDNTYKYINDIDGYRASEDAYWTKNATHTNDQGLSFPTMKPGYIDSNYNYMTDEEIGIFNYYYSKFGKEKAYEYLDHLQQTLNTRSAMDIREVNDTTFERLFFGVKAGLDQFGSGVKNLFNTSDDYITPSDTQIASGMIREDLADTGFEILGSSVGQIGYDLITTTSNMLPSILTSTVVGAINPTAGAVVGAGLMGTSAAGNAYAEALNLGFDKGQARMYSTMVGVSETLLQYALGGISKLGGKLTTQTLTKYINNIDNAFARVSLKLGTNMASEFTEEYLQEVLTPYFKNLALGTNEDINLFSTDALYSGILGALSAGILEGGSTISTDVQTSNLGQKVQKVDGGVERLKKLGTTFSADSVAYQIADKVTEETGAYKIGLLLQEVGGTLSEQNVSDIVIELTKKDMAESDAKKIAKVYQAFLNEEMSLTDKQVEVLEGLHPLADVLRKNIIGRNTDIYQRTREYSDLIKLATEMNVAAESSPAPQTEAPTQTAAPYSQAYVDSVVKELEATGMTSEQAKIVAEMKLSTPTMGKSYPETENVVESKYEIADDGKTTNLKTGTATEIKNIASISSSGEVNLTLDDKMVVKASDIAFSSPVERAFVENIGGIKLGKKNISTASANALYQLAMTAWKNNPNMSATEAMSLIKGLEESYVYGAYNFSKTELTNSEAVAFAHELDEEQRKFAYEQGSKDRADLVQKEQNSIENIIETSYNEDISINEEETSALLSYKSSESYKINEALRDGETLTSSNKKFVKNLDSALSKLPIYHGTVYRNISFDDLGGQVAFDNFLKEHDVGNFVSYRAFTSSSTKKDGYTIEGNYVVEMVIESTNARDVDGYGNNFESEVIFHRNSEFIVNHISYDNGQPIIYMTEVIENVGEKHEQLHTEKRSETVQSVSKSSSETRYDNLRGVPEENTSRNFGRRQSLQEIPTKQGFIEETKTHPKVAGKSFGKVIFEDGANVDESALTSTQKASLNGIKLLAEISSVEFHVFRSDKVGNTYKYTMPDGTVTGANGWYVAGSNQIWIDLNAGNFGEGTMIRTAAHEISHYIKAWSPVRWKAMADLLMADFAKNGVDTKSMLNRQIDKIKRRCTKENMPSREKLLDMAYEELVSDALSDMLTDGSIVNLIAEVKAKDRSLAKKILTAIKNLLKKWGLIIEEYQSKNLDAVEAQALSQLEDTFKKLQKLYQEAFMDANNTYSAIGNIEAQKNTTNKGDVRLQARELQRKDPTKLTESELIRLLEYVEDKTLSDDTYIPVRINTPQILITFAKEFGYTLESHPLAMKVYKARQALSNEENWDGDYKDKPHDLSPEEVIDIIKAMNNPSYLVFQTENERFAEIVKFQKEHSKEKAYAIIDFSDVDKNPDLMNGYKGGKYNILVTVYPSDDTTKLKQYLSNKSHKVITGQQIKKKDKSQGSYGGNAPSLLNDSPFFNDSITQPDENIKKNDVKNSDKDIESKSNVEVKLSDRDYSYDTLISKPDMKMTTVGGHIPTNRADIVAQAKKNAASVGKANKDGSVSVYVDDVGRDVLISTNSLKHSLDRRMSINAPVMLKIGEILGNSIRINELNPREDNIEKTYVLVGAAVNDKGEPYIVSFVVNSFTNEITSVDVLYSANAKTEPAGSLSPRVSTPATDSVISISDLLDYVNKYFPDILPESVLKHFGHQERPAGKLGESALFSERDPDSSNRTILANVLESAVQNDIEKSKLAQYKEKISLIEAAEQRLSEIRKQLFSKGGADSTKRKELQLEAKQIANRINIYDRQLLNLEATTALKNVLNREKTLAMKRQKDTETIAKGMQKPVDNIAKTNIITSAEGDVMLSDRAFSYDELVAKDDLKGVVIDKTQQPKIANGIIDGAWIVNKVREKCEMLEGKGKPTYYVNVPDIGTNVEITAKGLTHGFARPNDRRQNNSKLNAIVNARVALALPQILENSIEVNRSQRGNNIDVPYTHVLIGTAALEDNNGVLEYYVVRSMVQERENQNPILVEADVLGKLTSVNAKKIDSPTTQVGGNTVALVGGRAYAYKISDLLNDVKDIFDNTFSEDVYRRLGTTRTADDFSKKLLFSERDPSASNRSILANALEGVAQNDIEKNKLKEYKEKIDLINSEEQRLSEIQKRLFTKGGVDPSQRKDLQFEAKQIANRINTYDRQLLKLEAAKPLQNVLTREKELARKRQKQQDTEALRAYKEKVAETTRELVTRHQESRKKAVEGREKTAMRHKIQKVVGELNQLLLRGTKDKHVMIGLQKAVAEALDAVNMDTVGAEERVAKYNTLIAKATDPDVIASLTETRDRIQAQGDKMSDKLTRLKNAYNDIKNSDDPLIANSYDEVISSRLEYIAEKVGNTPLRDMTLEQLEDVYDMYKMVLTTIRNSNKAFKSAKNESIATLANRVMMEVEKIGGNKKYVRSVLEGVKKFGWNALKPVYAFKVIGSNTFADIYNTVRSGEDTWAVDISEAKDFYQEKTQKYNYNSWDLKQKHSFTSTSGKSFDLTLEQIMSLYAYSKREQACQHLRYGGFVFDSSIEVTEKSKLGIPMKYKVNTADAYNLSIDTLGEIVGTLTEEQKAFVDEMQSYLSTEMGAKGNEVSLEMYGVKLFKENNYFPLKSAKQFMFEQNETAGEVKIKNSGFSKETVPKANNPIILNNFTDAWANHVNDMSMYHSFVLPLEDFNRVFNYKTNASDSTASESVKMFLQNVYGDQANQYIKQLLTDLNGGVRADSSADWINKSIGLFKKAGVFSSASVVIQQPSALARAWAYVDPKYFVFTKMGIKEHRSVWNEVKKYAPVAIIKEMGRFDTHVGRQTTEWIKSNQYEGLGQKAKALVTDSAYRDDILSRAPALADEITWCYIWNAIKKETKATTNLKEDSEEFLKKCGEKFTEVVKHTQVYDSVLSRSGHMRSKDTGMKMATAFMAEPTTTLNMMVDAKIQATRGNTRFARKTIGAAVASIILNSILVAIVYAARDDDEDETYAEKYLGSLITELIEGFNPLTYIPFVKDLWSIGQGYDVERSDMSIYSKLWRSVENLFNDNLSGAEKAVDFAGSVASLLGLPLKNILRDTHAVYNVAEGILRGTQTTGAGIGYALQDAVRNSVPLVGRFYKEASNSTKLYDAIVSGDQTQIDRVNGLFKDDKAIESAMRSGLRENDSRIQDAALARMDGDIAEYTRIVKAIKAEGNFVQDTIVAAVNAEINALSKGEDSSSSSDKAKSMYKIDDYFMALDGGDEATAYLVKGDLIKTDVANGKDREEAEDSFNGRFASYVREQYEEGNLSEYEAEKMLVNHGGRTEEDAASKVQYWEFKQEYPDYDDLSEEAVDKYYSEVEPHGISVDVYYDYSKQRSKCKGVDTNGDGKTDSGSKKAEILQVIHSLPLTYAQKDALYYLNGWSSKTIYEAPWR